MRKCHASRNNLSHIPSNTHATPFIATSRTLDDLRPCAVIRLHRISLAYHHPCTTSTLHDHRNPPIRFALPHPSTPTVPCRSPAQGSTSARPALPLPCTCPFPADLATSRYIDSHCDNHRPVEGGQLQEPSRTRTLSTHATPLPRVAPTSHRSRRRCGGDRVRGLGLQAPLAAPRIQEGKRICLSAWGVPGGWVGAGDVLAEVGLTREGSDGGGEGGEKFSQYDAVEKEPGSRGEGGYGSLAEAVLWPPSRCVRVRVHFNIWMAGCNSAMSAGDGKVGMSFSILCLALSRRL